MKLSGRGGSRCLQKRKEQWLMSTPTENESGRVLKRKTLTRGFQKGTKNFKLSICPPKVKKNYLN